MTSFKIFPFCSPLEHLSPCWVGFSLVHQSLDKADLTFTFTWLNFFLTILGNNFHSHIGTTCKEPWVVLGVSVLCERTVKEVLS